MKQLHRVGRYREAMKVLADATGATVLGYNYLDITADAMLTAARGSLLLRYVLESNFGSHSEGDRLPGEPTDGSPQAPADFEAEVEIVAPSGWEDAVQRIAAADVALVTQARTAGDATAVARPFRNRRLP